MIFLLACIPDLEVLSFADEHNFQFSSSLFSDPVQVQAENDLDLDWSLLTQDLLGNAINPEQDIAKISLLLFASLSHEQVLAGVSNENLRQSDLSGYAEYFPSAGEVRASVTQFSLQGVDVDPVEHLYPNAGTFMLLAANAREESLMLSFFETVEDSSVVNVGLSSQSTSLSYTANLREQERLSAGPAQRYVLDWSQLTKSGTGTPLQGGQLDSIMIAGFSESIAELETQFLQLPTLADEIYILDLEYETAIDMERLREEGFQNFSTQDRWLIALRCSRCLNPAPLFVGIIEN